MVQEKKKEEWTTPKIEQINLEFDKEMATACRLSSNTPNLGSCGYSTDQANSCWNSNRPQS